MAFRDAIAVSWLPQLRAFAPEFILVSAGFDDHETDPLGQLEREADDFAWIAQEIIDLAHQFASDRVVSTLEGGYEIDALGECAVSHVQRMADA